MFAFSWTNDFFVFEVVDLDFFNPKINLEVSLVYLNPFLFLNTYFAAFPVSTFSFFDLIFCFIYLNSANSSFFNFFFLDNLLLFSFFFNLFFWTSSLGWDYSIFFFSNDFYYFFYLSAFVDYIFLFVHSVNSAVVYDSYLFQLFSYLSILPPILPYLIYVYAFTLLSLFISSSSTLSTSFSFYIFRLLYFISSLLTENRLPKLLFSLFIFFIFFWFFFLITFNDIEAGVIDLCHFFLFFSFFSLIVFFIWRYSIHFFSFLETTLSENMNVSFLLRQFIRDFSNLLALFLRFFLLLFRLNIYDNLDDFLDSYYIFFCDFDEDIWTEEFFLFTGSSLIENFSDSVELFKQEWDLSLFSFFFIVWSKFVFFTFFVLEEVFRIVLSLYIVYLILFEIHSTNISFSETKFNLNS